MIIDVTSEKAPSKWSSLPTPFFCPKILSNFGFTSEKKKVFFVFLVLVFLTVLHKRINETLCSAIYLIYTSYIYELNSVKHFSAFQAQTALQKLLSSQPVERWRPTNAPYATAPTRRGPGESSGKLCAQDTNAGKCRLHNIKTLMFF